MATLSSNAAMPDGVPDLRFSEPGQKDTLQQINIIANSISIASASTVLIILLAMRIYDYRLVDRVSLRLTAATSLTDLISSVSLLLYCYTDSNGSACHIAAFLIIWLTNQYMFLTTAIAFNLQWLFLQSRYYNPVFEKWYYIVSVALSLLTAVLPLSSNVLGFDVAQGVCWYTDSYTLPSQIWEYGTYIGPQIVCLTYCTTVVVLVVVKLLRDAKSDLVDDDEVNAMPSTSQTVVSRVVRRILLYPTTPLLTQLGFIVSEIYMFSTLRVSYELNVWGVLTKALPGFFNLVGFLMDPAFMGALRLLKRDLIRRYGDTQTDLHRSSSHRSIDKRSYKIYADHGALDFVMPRDTTCASLAPLAKEQPQKTSNNRCMRWLVKRFCKPAAGPDADAGASGAGCSSLPTCVTITEIHTEKTPSSENLPTFLNSPTAYLIGEDIRRDFIGNPTAAAAAATPSSSTALSSTTTVNAAGSPPRRQREQQENNSTTGCFSVPVFLEDQLDEAVPWRVLEATDEQYYSQHDQQQQQQQQQYQQQQQPRGSCSNGTYSDREVDSWLELSEPISPSRMSQWLNKRGDSFELVRERVARSSKSIRRWCRQQQQLHQDDQLDKVEEPDLLDTSRWSRTLSGSYFDHTLLQSVPESHLESVEEASRRHY
ncbi:hypothetical protein BDB00DRAFT_926759 [Zychaea mexicana]|uniref:uncharacterized protein n=1 Tax=Zychaea mexicana TaxID=64656 RepID=UPI0022FE4F23|nr:uncharacterized protein BDB00DRAFT_926759 [Zychaea mexicana]KAI9496560.1 hypothetical protein BDB00DRAFT_926759 [Zychaea mexicana]